MRIDPLPIAGGFGILALLWIALIVAFWVLVIAGLFYGVRWLIRADRNSRPSAPPPSTADPTMSQGAAAPNPDDPLEVLRLRYARGEIDEDEFERRRRTLTGG